MTEQNCIFRGGKLIGVTQPRRVAAIAMSKRVAEEMNLSTGTQKYNNAYTYSLPDIKMKLGIFLFEILLFEILISCYLSCRGRVIPD